jgi:hypothetical protein
VHGTFLRVTKLALLVFDQTVWLSEALQCDKEIRSSIEELGKFTFMSKKGKVHGGQRERLIMAKLREDSTANSTDEQILRAIDEAGEPNNRHYKWRDYDKPEEGEKKGWVIPNDIGVSTAKDPSLVRRLKALVAAGKLEERFNCNMPRYKIP